ncbi:MAG: hypothetical protein WC227_03995 [Patescibacteria group bacterium]|jgi:hypothetical protein
MAKKTAKDSSKYNHARKAGYASLIVANTIMIWVVSNLLAWHVPFLTSDFNSVQWMLTLSYLAAIVGYLLLILHDPKWFHGFVRLIMNTFGFLALLSLFFVFPFDFSMYSSFNWDRLAKIVLGASSLGTAIGIIIEFMQLIFRKDYRAAEE